MDKCIIFLSKYEDYLKSARKIKDNSNLKVNINYIEELPEILQAKIEYFFMHYKDLQPNAWSKVIGWGDRDKADSLIMESIERYKKNK